ncbi:MAG: aldo/keto reductase [Ruthenibacterium sp.]
MNRFGFGCMRLPMKNGAVDTAEFSQMVDRFLAEGFTYFDTAHGYLSGQSETALRTCLTSRYPREQYQLTDKLSTNFFDNEAEIRPLFESQLAACGVSYFDYYLMHSQTAEYYEKFIRCNAYRTAFALKAEGKVRHVGISFHDKAAVLERILSEQPDIEAVQLQFNYADYDDPDVEGRKCLAVCQKYGKPVIVMEPVKGGRLVDLPEKANRVFNALHGGSAASYAIRYAASFHDVMMVLSGMSNVAQMEDNVSFMKNFKPLTADESAAVATVCDILRANDTISCTACRYCVDDCPMHIAIPDLFACLNHNAQNAAQSRADYAQYTQTGGKASACIRCGKCEKACPQHLEIRTLLTSVAKTFENIS